MDTCICLGCSSSSLKAAKTNASVHSTHIAPHPPTHPRKTLLINTLSTTLPPPPNFTSLDTPTLPPMPTHCSTFQRDSPKPYLHVLSNMIVSNKKPAARPPNTKNPAASHPPPRCPVVLHAHQSRTPVCRSIDIVSGTCWRAATPSTKQKPSCPPSAPSPFSPKSTHESRTPVCQSTLSPPHAPPQHPKRSMRPPPPNTHTRAP